LEERRKRKSPFFWQFLTQIDAHLPHFQKYQTLEKVGITNNFGIKMGGGSDPLWHISRT